ncbi:MAG: hypothetical protein IPH78_12395 [Bacteroidetes bacterium]|nr:hypothetical protein [Bacteroidota bacterium]
MLHLTLPIHSRPARTLAGVGVLLLLFAYTQAQTSYCFPKQQGSKWGVQQWEYGSGGRDDTYKWIHKPRWEMVRTDSSTCFGGRECTGFFTYKGGKMGYAWCYGELLENEYDTICHYTARKGGKWGGIDKSEIILPFEYDSLVYLNFAKQYWTNATRNAYGALKNGKWQIVVVRQPYQQPAVVEPAFSEPYEAIDRFDNGAALKKNGTWVFADLRKPGKPVYSQPYEDIAHIMWHHAVRLNGRWYPLRDETMLPGTDKGWDKLEKTNIAYFILAWENGLAGIIKYEKGNFKLLIEPRATAARIYGEYSTGYTIELTENGQKVTYNEQGQLLSRTGDLTVSHSAAKGPFRIDWNKKNQCTIYDAATNTVLVPESDLQNTYEKHPLLGDVLWIKDETYPGSRRYRYGLVHYASKTYLKPEFENEFQFLDQRFIYNHLPNGEYKLWHTAHLQPLNAPFSITAVKSIYQNLLRDYTGNWHQLDEAFTIMPRAQVIDTRKTILGGMEIEAYDDNSQKLLALNGKPVNKYIQRQRWIESSWIAAVTIDGVEKEYFLNGNRAEECRYALGNGVIVRHHAMAEKPWPGEAFNTPLLLADSAGKLLLINGYNNKRMYTSVPLTGEQVLFEGRLYKLLDATAANSLSFSCKEMVKCNQCTNGYNPKVVKRTIKGETTYDTKKVTTMGSSVESKWNPNTNSYQYVKVNKPSTSYETIEHKEPDREVEETIQVRCKVCNGDGKVEITRSIYWNGTTLKPSDF